MGVFGTSKMKLFAGSDKVKKAYLGTEKIYSAGSIVTYYVDSNTYYQEEVDSDASCLNPTTFTPSKSGWEFVGWREDTIASGDVLSSKIMGDEPISLFAVFSQSVTGNFVSYNKTDTIHGTRYYNNGNIVDASVTAPSGASYPGWTFDGWAWWNDSVDVILSVDHTLTVSSDFYIYGLYSQNVTLTYYDNNSIAQYKYGTRYYKAYGFEKNPSFTMTQTTDSGWTCRGWSTTNKGDASIQYANGATITLTGNLTIYGLYQTTATLSYNGNGATSGSVSSQSGTIYWAPAGYIYPTVTLKSNGFSRTDYSFSGWNLGAAGATITLTGNTTAYAQWVQTVSSFSHNQGVQSYTVPVSGTYKLEVWGAKGGTQPSGEGVAYDNGGNGGYAYGNKYLTAGQVIYICCGGYYSHANGAIRSAYNGGGAGYAWGGYGGGATHIATTNRGVLSNYDSYRSEVLIVAGGGGGSGYYCEIKDDDDEVIDDYYATGGTGGGTSGGKGDRHGGYGGTQTAGGAGGPGGQVSEMSGSFGQGGYSDYHRGSGGGGGWYGGGGGESGQGGGGGSGYIGGVSSGGMSNGVNAGQGKAKITLIT